jgi:hypothetical protein
MKMAIALLLALLSAATAQVATTPPPTKDWQVEVRRNVPIMTGEDTSEATQVVHLTLQGDAILLTTWSPCSPHPGVWERKMQQIRIDVDGWEDLLPTLRQALAQNQP